MKPTAIEFVALARKQIGDKYILGAQAKHDDPDPHVFDCSEMVEWLSAQAGLKLFAAGDPHAMELWERCMRAGTTISVKEAREIPGALIWKRKLTYKPRPIHHIGISAGIVNGRWEVIEAKGRKYGVVLSIDKMWSDKGVDDVWNLAALVPGLDYSETPQTDAEKKEDKNE